MLSIAACVAIAAGSTIGVIKFSQAGSDARWIVSDRHAVNAEYLDRLACISALPYLAMCVGMAIGMAASY